MCKMYQTIYTYMSKVCLYTILHTTKIIRLKKKCQYCTGYFPNIYGNVESQMVSYNTN